MSGIPPTNQGQTVTAQVVPNHANGESAVNGSSQGNESSISSGASDGVVVGGRKHNDTKKTLTLDPRDASARDIDLRTFRNGGLRANLAKINVIVPPGQKVTLTIHGDGREPSSRSIEFINETDKEIKGRVFLDGKGGVAASDGKKSTKLKSMNDLSANPLQKQFESRNTLVKVEKNQKLTLERKIDPVTKAPDDESGFRIRKAPAVAATEKDFRPEPKPTAKPQQRRPNILERALGNIFQAKKGKVNQGSWPQVPKPVTTQPVAGAAASNASRADEGGSSRRGSSQSQPQPQAEVQQTNQAADDSDMGSVSGGGFESDTDSGSETSYRSETSSGSEISSGSGTTDSERSAEIQPAAGQGSGAPTI